MRWCGLYRSRRTDWRDGATPQHATPRGQGEHRRHAPPRARGERVRRRALQVAELAVSDAPPNTELGADLILTYHAKDAARWLREARA